MADGTSEEILNKMLDKILVLGEGLPANVAKKFVYVADQSSNIPLDADEEAVRVIIRTITMHSILHAYWLGVGVALGTYDPDSMTAVEWN